MFIINYFSTHCNFRVMEGATLCKNQNCPSLHNSQGSLGTTTSAFSLSKIEEGFTTESDFNLLVGLSDYTGGLEGVRLMGHAASEALGLTVSLTIYISL